MPAGPLDDNRIDLTDGSESSGITRKVSRTNDESKPTDTQLPDSYVEMFGGGARFAGHPGGGNTARRIVRIDKSHPASKDWVDGLPVVDEFYQFRNFDRAKVHSLLDMAFEGQLLPVAWVKRHGKGRMFYTSMGHRDDVMLPDIPSLDYGNQKQNSNSGSEPSP